MDLADRKPPLRTLAVILGVAFSVIIPAWQAATDFGLSPAEFSRDGDSTLRVAGYAFSIWSVIYLGLIAFAVHQLRSRETQVLRAVTWPAALAAAGCGAWILASAIDLSWATVAVIAASAAAAIWGLLRVPSWGERLSVRVLVLWPLSLLAGWLTVASAVNVLTVLTSRGVIAPEAALAWGVGGVLTVAAIAAAVLSRAPAPLYGAAVAWGLVGVFAAERDQNPILAYVALAAALLVFGYGVWRAWRGS